MALLPARRFRIHPSMESLNSPCLSEDKSNMDLISAKDKVREWGRRQGAEGSGGWGGQEERTWGFKSCRAGT